MRIVDVTQCYGAHSGGIRTYLHAKAAHTAARGLDHAIVVPGATGEATMLHRSRLVAVRGRTPSQRWGYRMVPRASTLVRAVGDLRPDVIVLHDCMAFPRSVAAWAAARGVPVAMVCHSDLRLSPRGLPRPLGAAATVLLDVIQRRGLSAPSALIIPSDETHRRVDRDIRCRVERITLGVDLSTFTAARPDERLRDRLAPRGAPLLLYAGRLSSEKGLELLARMLVMLPDARLAVAGAGAAEAALVRTARRLGVGGRVRFLGFIADREELARHMATADCFVHPNAHEPYGLTPLEALAAGCRVVAPDSGGCRETLAHRGAMLVRPNDVAALAEGVRRSLARPRPTPELGDLAWERTFEAEWAVYRSLLGDERRGRPHLLPPSPVAHPAPIPTLDSERRAG